jgi:hypothetical protein
LDNLCGELGYVQWIIAGGTSIWTLEELDIVRQALLAIKRSLQGIGNTNWMDLFGGVKFRRTTTSGPAEFRHMSNLIWLESRWGEDSDNLNLLRLPNMFRIVLHELGHAIDYHSNSAYYISRLNSFIPHDTRGDYTYTGAGYWYRDPGRVSKDRAPRQAFGDIFAAWVWHDSHMRGYKDLAMRPDVGTGYQSSRRLSFEPVDWDKMYSLMVSLLED